MDSLSHFAVWTKPDLHWLKNNESHQTAIPSTVGHTSGPGGPGNPTGPLSPTFPCRNQKKMEKSELAPSCWLSCWAEHTPAKLSFQLGTQPLEREIRKQRTSGYLPGGLASLVPQGPQANLGYPEKEREREEFWENTTKHQKTPIPPAPAPDSAETGGVSKQFLSPARSQDDCPGISEMSLLKLGMTLALRSTWAAAVGCGSGPCRPQCGAKYSLSQLKSASRCSPGGAVICSAVPHSVKCFTGSGFKLLHRALKFSESAAAGPHTGTPVQPCPIISSFCMRIWPFIWKATSRTSFIISNNKIHLMT